MNTSERPAEPSEAFTKLDVQERVTGVELKAAMQGYAASLETVDEHLIPRLIGKAELSAEELADIGERLIGIDWTGKSDRAKQTHRRVLTAIHDKQDETVG